MADAEPPRTTVVIPVWDEYAGERLAAALDSIAGQDVAVEVVVVDNASHVELPPYPDVSVVRAPERLTLGAARNLGLDRVRTPYTMAWDADDLMVPGSVRVLEDAMRADPGLAAFAAGIVDEAGVRHRWPRRWIARLVHAPRLLALLDCVWSMYPTTGATIMRTDLARGAGGYADADSGEDWCLGVSLVLRGRVGWSERPGRVYRVQAESTWARHKTVPHLLRHARTVRTRLREDAGVPGWIRAALPLIAVGQWSAIAGHALLDGARRVALRASWSRG